MNASSGIHADQTVAPGPVRKRGDEVLDLSDLVLAVWRKKLQVLAACLVGAALSLVWTTQISSPVYHATAVLVMEATPEPSVDLEAFVPGFAAENSAINTEIEIISSRTLLSKLVDALNLTKDPEFNPELGVSKLDPVLARMRNFGIWPTLPSSPADLRPALVQTATIDQLYNKVSVRNVPDSLVFEVTVESGNRKKAALLANTLADLYIERQVELKYTSNKTAVDWLTRRVSELGKELEAAERLASTFGAKMQIINPDTIEALQLKLIEVRDRMTALQVAQDRSGTSRGNEEQLRRLQVVETDLSERILRQSEDVVELNQLVREAESSRLVYESFLARLKETSDQPGLQNADSVVLSRAEIAQFPAKPRPFAMMLVGLIAAGAFFVGYVLYREIGRTSFRTSEELAAAFPVPVLGKIRRLPSGRRKTVPHVFAKSPGLETLEDMRGLRATYLASSPPSGCVSLVTSSLPGEGKTTHALLFAQALGEAGQKTLLIEADLRRPSLNRFFGVKSARSGVGLDAVLRGESELRPAISRPKDGKYFVLRAGNPPEENPATLLSKPEFAEVLDEASDMFDHVIVDSPPVLSVPDAKVMAGSVDRIIYVVQWNRSVENDINRGLATFSGVGRKVDGILMTQIDPQTMRRLGASEYKTKY